MARRPILLPFGSIRPDTWESAREKVEGNFQDLYGLSLDLKKFDFLGESRTALMVVNPAILPAVQATQSTHWFNIANALMNSPMKWGLCLAVSGLRSDQYINAGLSQALASNAGWLVFDFPAVNDLAAQPSLVFPYTNSNGVIVTSTNVAQIAAGNIIAAANQALAVGKKVLLTLEYGSTSLTAGPVAQMHELNLRLRAYAEATPGVYIWSANSVLWNATGSATLVVFKTGFASDGTHLTTLGSYFAGKAFKNFISSLIPNPDFGPASINDVQTTNPLQLMPNPLFNTLTGGTVTGGIVLTSGNVPSGLQIIGIASTSVIVTSGANANGWGNDVTFAFTAGAADNVKLTFTAPSNTLWQLTDIMEGGIDLDMAAGSSKAAVYWQTSMNTDLGAQDSWALYAGGTNGDGPTEAYSYRLRSPPASPKLNSVTKSFLTLRLTLNFSAAGNATITLRRPTTERRFA